MIRLTKPTEKHTRKLEKNVQLKQNSWVQLMVFYLQNALSSLTVSRHFIELRGIIHDTIFLHDELYPPLGSNIFCCYTIEMLHAFRQEVKKNTTSSSNHRQSFIGATRNKLVILWGTLFKCVAYKLQKKNRIRRGNYGRSSTNPIWFNSQCLR